MRWQVLFDLTWLLLHCSRDIFLAPKTPAGWYRLAFHLWLYSPLTPAVQSALPPVPYRYGLHPTWLSWSSHCKQPAGILPEPLPELIVFWNWRSHNKFFEAFSKDRVCQSFRIANLWIHLVYDRIVHCAQRGIHAALVAHSRYAKLRTLRTTDTVPCVMQVSPCKLLDVSCGGRGFVVEGSLRPRDLT